MTGEDISASEVQPDNFMRPRRLVPLVLCAAMLAYFAIFFNESRWQPTVDLAWLAAVVCWIVGLWSAQHSRAPRVPHPYWFYVLYILILIPFATNWRWGMTGDSLGWALTGIDLAEHGPRKSLLSLHGIGQFGYGQQALHNVFMVLIKPTLFWHRFGQIMVGVATMAAIVGAYGRLVSPNFGLLVGACTLSTAIMIVHTLCSYPLLDAVAGANAVLAAAVWVRQDPNARRAWLLLGFFTGLQLHLTPSGWAMGLCVWLWIGPQALYRRWPRLNLVAAVGCALIVALPVLIQFALGQGEALFSQIEKPDYTVEKVFRFFRESLTLPFWSNNEVAGAFGPQLPEYFRYLFVPGIVLTPFLVRYFPGAFLIATFFVIHCVLMSFMQGTYPSVSVKRALVLIPMATYFVFLPFQRYLRALPVVLVVIALWASFGVRNMLYDFRPGRTGYTLFDGVIEVNQRFSDAPVCVYLPTDQRGPLFAPGSELDRLYGLYPHVQRVSDVNDPRCATYLCYCPQANTLDLAAIGYTPIPLLASVELRCGRK
jgi:hypothetical protein